MSIPNAGSGITRTILRLGLLLSALLMVGCAAQPQSTTGPSAQQTSTNDGFMTYSQLVAQYEAAQASMPLAPGAKYPPFPDGYDKSGLYQAMYGQSIAFGVYQCSWESEWLNTRATDSARASTALSVLLKIPENIVFVQTYDASLQTVMTDAYNKASLGDPSGVQSLAAAC